jgi:arylsulfatase
LTLTQPFDERDFELFDLRRDPGETRDLSAAEPERRAAMLDLWRAERRRFGIVLPEDL